MQNIETLKKEDAMDNQNAKEQEIGKRSAMLSGINSSDENKKYIMQNEGTVTVSKAEMNKENNGDEELHENTIKLMTPMQMVLRRFFRSKLSIVGLVMIVALFIFCWLGPVVYNKWDSTEVDSTGRVEYSQTAVKDENGNVLFYQIIETGKTNNYFAKPDGNHPMGTDKNARDVLARLMVGGRISLTISFLSVFAITLLGVIFGGISGYFGGAIDNIIMRICDILMCLPGFPILLIVGTLVEAAGIDLKFRIYYLMAFLTIISWSGTARLVRGQILSLREQEYMVAAEAMGYSTFRKIFKHLVPNVMPQLIVQMTLSLGSMILYEASLSYLGLGAPEEYAAWGTMINSANDVNILQNYFNIWGPPGICIIIAVLGFNFVGDGLRDALDPKMRR